VVLSLSLLLNWIVFLLLIDLIFRGTGRMLRFIHCKNPWDRPYFACYDAGTVAVNTCGAEAV